MTTMATLKFNVQTWMAPMLKISLQWDWIAHRGLHCADSNPFTFSWVDFHLFMGYIETTQERRWSNE